MQAKPWPEGGSSVFRCVSADFDNEKYKATYVSAADISAADIVAAYSLGAEGIHQHFNPAVLGPPLAGVIRRQRFGVGHAAHDHTFTRHTGLLGQIIGD